MTLLIQKDWLLIKIIYLYSIQPNPNWPPKKKKKGPKNLCLK
jgi:hypothetical protein